MEATLLRLNEHWSGKEYASLHGRALMDGLKKKQKLPHIQVLTGIRRSGKSTIFRLLINDLMQSGVPPKAILMLNLDEPVFTPLWDNAADLYRVVEAAEKLTAVKVQYLFLDEVQQVKDWELFAKGAYDTQRFAKLYITGSNSDLLHNKFATLLSGRYIANMVRPFSLKELLQVHGIADMYGALSHRAKLLRLTDAYLEWGSFPEIALLDLDNSIKTELLNSYYTSIVLKDCIVYNQVRDSALFKRLLHFVISNAGAPFSYGSLAKAVNSNENTVRSYLSFACRSYVIADVVNFSLSLKETSRLQHKVYGIDNGLMNAVGFRFSQRYGTMLENAVYNELVNRGFENISFMSRSGECDFVAQHEGDFHGFQVCYDMNTLNREREVAGFEAGKGEFTLRSKTLITYNQQEQIGDIRAVPFWQFFGIE